MARNDRGLQSLEDFKSREVDVGAARLFARIGGAGPPLLLLHGFPQTHLCWGRIAPQLARHFTLVLADLTGYGQSRGPIPDDQGSNYSKRAIAGHMVALMEALGHKRFSLAGHDRGGRVAYRLALDHAERVERLAVLSILPTFAMWRRLGDVEKAMNTYHWLLLAQPPPIPHDLLLGAPNKQVRNTIASWTKSRTLDAFTTSELQAYAAAYSQPDSIAAVCADYRGSWTTDREVDEADIRAGRKIQIPALALWGTDEYPAAEMSASWRELAPDIQLAPIDSGHFVVEEAPRETATALGGFFSDRGAGS
jgi:haloacetate dehalogenase